MLRSFLRTAWRALTRRPGFSAINLVGLSVGMTCCLLIGLYVQNELSYDRFHPDHEQVYRIVQDDVEDNRGIGWIGDGILDVLRGVPQVETVVQLTRGSGSLARAVDSTRASQVVEESGLLYATPSALTVFDLPLQSGDPATALSDPGSIVLTPALAEKYFGADTPMGHTLTFDGEHTLTVTGVLEPLPPNTHLAFDALLSRSTFFTAQGRPATTESSSFWWPQTWTYVRLHPEADVQSVQQQIEAETDTRRSDDIAAEFAMVLQPLADIHLHSSTIMGNLGPVGSLPRVWTFGTIAAFILLIASVNFMNLSTARATERAREVGVRKAVGANRQQLIGQFIGESVLLSGGSIALALGMTRLLQPAFEALMDVELAVGVGANPVLLSGAALAMILTGVGAGSYPAFVLSRFQPTDVLRESIGGVQRGMHLRKSLVVVQFAISVVLLVATAVAWQQLRFLQTADLGFDDEHVVTLDAHGAYETLKTELQNQPEVQTVSGASLRPGIGWAANTLNYEMDGTKPPADDNNLSYQQVDAGYFEMLDIDVVAGRTFEAGRRSDLGTVHPSDDEHFSWWWTDRALIVNRAAVREVGGTPDEVLGRTIRVYQAENGMLYNDVAGTVVGVVEDFHTASLRREIPPTVFVPSATPLGEGEDQRIYYAANYLLAKVAPGNAQQVMDTFRSVWNDVNPDAPFQASFLDESLNQLYRSEARTGRIIGLFSGLAIFIACLGLFGLATHSAQRRRKEIGIRKAVGASVTSIVKLLSADFLKLVIVAVVLGAPLAYVLVQRWLSDFAYRVDLGVWPFAAAALAAILIALGTVSTQALRASRINPAETLRSE